MERKLVYTVQEAARMIGVGKNTIYALPGRGKSPSFR